MPRMDATTAVLVLGGAGLLMLALSAVMSRRATGTTARLTAIEHRLGLIMDHLGVAEPEPDVADIVERMVAGKKVEAIKLYRQRTGLGLREAKDAVEEIARRRL